MDELTDHERARIEREELALLLGQGMTFTVRKRSLLRYVGKPERTFLIPPLIVLTMDRLAAEYIETDFHPERIGSQHSDMERVWESNRLMRVNALRMARIVAIAVLNGRPGSRWLQGLYTWYFSRHLTSSILINIALMIQKGANLSDFVGSIGLFAVVTTHLLTTPKPVEENQKGVAQD